MVFWGNIVYSRTYNQFYNPYMTHVSQWPFYWCTKRKDNLVTAALWVAWCSGIPVRLHQMNWALIQHCLTSTGLPPTATHSHTSNSLKRMEWCTDIGYPLSIYLYSTYLEDRPWPIMWETEMPHCRHWDQERNQIWDWDYGPLAEWWRRSNSGVSWVDEICW